MEFSHQKVINFFENVAQAIITHARYIVFTIAGVLIVALAAVGYSYYRHGAQAHAYKDLQYAMHVYDAPTTKTDSEDNDIAFASEEEKWKKLEEVARAGLQAHAGSTAAPEFGALLAEALLSQGKQDEAISVFEDAAARVPSKPLREFYELKVARMKLDSEKYKDEGFAALKRAADDASNYAHEAALFYLGYYYWDKKEYMQVKNYWRQLVVKYGLKDGQYRSGFADTARQKLSLITADI